MNKDTTPHLKSQAIYIDGKDRTDEIESYSLEGGKCVVVYKNNGKSYSYHQNKIQIVKSALQTRKAERIFSHLKEIAESIGLKTEEGNNILAGSYERISFIPENSILSNYLNQKKPEKNVHDTPIEIFPFGFNLSQKDENSIVRTNVGGTSRQSASVVNGILEGFNIYDRPMSSNRYDDANWFAHGLMYDLMDPGRNNGTVNASVHRNGSGIFLNNILDEIRISTGNDYNLNPIFSRLTSSVNSAGDLKTPLQSAYPAQSTQINTFFQNYGY